MRDKFVSDVLTTSEKEFWRQFFDEVDKRDFLSINFKVKDFGLRINAKHLKGDTKNYSLMYTRKSAFILNRIGLNREKWDALNRLKNWCVDPVLADRFYLELNGKKLISSNKNNAEIIDIPYLLNYHTPYMLNQTLFDCIDLFS